jgi:queuosine precursor transporter
MAMSKDNATFDLRPSDLRPATPYRYYDLIMVAFVVVLLISNTVVVKPVQIGPWLAGGDILIFAFSYIFGDILTEVYGYARSRRVIWTGFAALLFMALIYTLVGLLPGGANWDGQEAYARILGQAPRIVLGSIVAFFCGEFCNSFVLARLKVLTRGRWLWTRTIGSTVVGQTIDTTLFAFIAFAGVLPIADIWAIIAFGIVSKVLYETLATPLTYAIVGWLKRAEGVDHYDDRTDFNPFRFSLPDDPTRGLPRGSAPAD